MSIIKLADGTLAIGTDEPSHVNCHKENWQYKNVVRVGSDPEKWNEILQRDLAYSGCKGKTSVNGYGMRNVHPEYIDVRKELCEQFFYNDRTREWATYSAAWYVGPGFRDKD